MAADDEDDVGTPSADPLGAGDGPRRATFETPPLPGDDRYDDDALADALAASFPSPITGAIPTLTPPAPASAPAPPPPAAEPEPELQPETAFEPEPAEPDPSAREESQPGTGESPAAWVPSAEDYRFAPPPSREDWPPPPEDDFTVDAGPAPIDDVPPPESDPAEPPPWASAPAPDPSQAVDLPQGPPQRPVRRSLPDDELIGWVEEAAVQPGGTLDVIEGLQSQLNLRIQEAREFSDWEQTMLADGSPEALAAVEEARPEFTGVLPDLGAALTGGAAATSTTGEPGAGPEPEASAEPVEAPPVEETGVAEETVLAADTTVEQDAPEDLVAETGEPDRDPLPEFAVPTGWFVPPVEVDAPAVPVTGEVPLDEAPEAPAPIDAFLEGEPPVVAVAGTVMPDEQLEPPTIETGSFEAESLEAENLEPESLEAETLEAETLEAETLEPESGEPDLAEPEPEHPADVDEAPHFLPEPSSEPLAPTAGVPIQPPPLVEPPPFGTSGVPKAPLSPAEAEATVQVPADPFESLLNGTDEEPLPAEPAEDRGIESLFIEPLPVVAGGQLSETGTIDIVDRAYEVDAEDDAIDETDRAVPALGPVAVDTAGIAVVPPIVHPPSGPISTVRIPPDETVLATERFEKPKVFSLEAASIEPTPTEQRIGKAARTFWLWFAANASLLSIALGAAIHGLGMSLRQTTVAILLGIALSIFPLGLSTLAGKRSGQPTMVVSRATFGLLGNIVPSVLSLISRVFWGAVLLWFLSTATSSLLIGAELAGGIGERTLQLIVFAIGLVLAVVIALFGYGLLAKVQLVISIVAGILVVGLIAMTANYVSLSQAMSTPDGPWILVTTGIVLVFSFVGLAWANSGGDLARYQRVESSGPAAAVWASFGATVPAFILIAYGALLAASNQGIASGFVTAPIDTLALMLPSWYPIPVLLAVGLSLLSGISITLYSGGFSLQAAGVRVARPIAVAICAALVAIIAVLLLAAFGGSVTELFRDVITTLAVPIAAWAGIFAAELMLRKRGFESMSLLHRGGIYADVRWTNLIALIVITVIGWGFTSATVGWLSWQGFGFALLGFGLDSDVAGTDLGVLVALGLGILVPIVLGIPAIRRQEAAEPVDA